MAIKVPQTENPSAHVKARAAKMRASVLRHIRDYEDVVEVDVETEPEKQNRVVCFIREKGELKITCYAKDSLVNCKANQVGLLCSHAHAAIEHLIAVHKERKNESEP